jgi:hypothetical protein
MFRAWMTHEHWLIWIAAAIVFILALAIGYLSAPEYLSERRAVQRTALRRANAGASREERGGRITSGSEAANWRSRKRRSHLRLRNLRICNCVCRPDAERGRGDNSQTDDPEFMHWAAPSSRVKAP